MATSGRTAATKAMGKGSTQFQHLIQTEVPVSLLETWQARTGDKTPHTSKNPKSKEIDLSGRKRKPDRHQPDWIIRKYFAKPAAR